MRSWRPPPQIYKPFFFFSFSLTVLGLISTRGILHPILHLAYWWFAQIIHLKIVDHLCTYFVVCVIHFVPCKILMLRRCGAYVSLPHVLRMVAATTARSNVCFPKHQRRHAHKNTYMGIANHTSVFIFIICEGLWVFLLWSVCHIGCVFIYPLWMFPPGSQQFIVLVFYHIHCTMPTHLAL